MGTAASTTQLTKDQKALITQKLKKLYDENASKDPTSLNNELTEEYQRLIEDFAKANGEHARPPSNEGSSSRAAVHSQDKGVAPRATGGKTSSFGVASSGRIAKNMDATSMRSGGGASAKGRTGRRRSFDLSSSKSSANTAGAAAAAAVAAAAAAAEAVLAVSKSANEIATLQEVADSWDSVSTQPYCDICKMAFKSPAFLERHVKFSSLHADNIKKSKEPVAPALTSPPKPNKKEIVTQEEGTHYRLLYSGSKFYWRSQETLDFDVYHHFLAQAVEIIPFDTRKQKELPRVYLDYEPIHTAVEKAVETEVDEKLAELKKDRFAEIPERSQLKEELLLKKLVTHILQRLRYESGVCDFYPSFADDPELFPVLEKRPVVLVPVTITRRRRSSAEEIQETLSSIRSDRVAINASLDKASQFTSADKANLGKKMEYSNKIANLVYSAACYLSAKPWYVTKSQPMQRWYRMVERVIRRNLVRKTRDFLDSKGLNIPKGMPRKRSLIMSPPKP